KKTLFWIAVLFLVSAIGSALAIDWYSFLIFRFVGGLAVGCSSVTAPMYISELSPASHRGRLVAMFQFNVVLGILVAFVSNYLLQNLGDNAWRWMLGIIAFPAAIFLVLILFIPESPRWLIVKRRLYEDAKDILQQINPQTANSEFESILASSNQSNRMDGSARLFSSRYAMPVTLAVLFAVFNQVSGINAIIYYAPRIFEMTGLGTDSALLSTVGLGVVNFVFTLLAMLALVASAFYTQSLSDYLVPVRRFAYIAFFAFSQGAVIWVFISEIFPNEVRAKGQALGSFTHWIMASLIAFAFPWVTERLGGGNTFMLFAVMMVFQLLFVWRIMPETKGKTLEQMHVAAVEARPGKVTMDK
ncbi:MAG: MFS transporter, partial [Cyclobacteriaceae bacterium]|nr:MFS transporter [Cyclobacteriaceae bacterium]